MNMKMSLKNKWFICIIFTLMASLTWAQKNNNHNTKANPQITKHNDSDDDELDFEADLDKQEKFLKEVLDENIDPLEPLNRFMFGFNQIFDFFLLKPLSTMISETMPDKAEMSLRNFVDNLFMPLNFINYMLQGDIERSTETMFRFIINSSIGIFGLFDVAAELGLKKQMTTFGETLARWGMGSGPYLILPILGPSSFRDTTGKIGDYFMNPLYQIAKAKKYTDKQKRRHLLYLQALYALDGVLFEVEHLKLLEDMQKNSFDFYVAMRSAYWQIQKKKEKEARNR